jgi:hypothetical protein
MCLFLRCVALFVRWLFSLEIARLKTMYLQYICIGLPISEGKKVILFGYLESALEKYMIDVP